MRMLSLGAVAVLALVLLAGCSGSSKSPPTTDPFASGGPKATATTGVLRGIVVDEAIRPLAGAAVYLTPTTPLMQTKTNDLGAFSFADLKPGTYFVQAVKSGYATAQQSSEVLAGVDEPPIVKVQLQRDASFVAPYFETYVLDGFMECSAGVVVNPDTLYGVANACSDTGTGVNAFPNDHTLATYSLSGKPMWVQGETVWTSTQAVSHTLSMSFAIQDASADDGWDDLSASGGSPLLNTMDAKIAAKYIDNGNLTVRIFPWADQAPGLVVASEQKFSVYVHVFYGYVPTADWRFSSGDPVPAPPA